MKLAKGTIVIVADGARMMLLRNDGNAVNPDLKVIGQDSLKNPPNREQLSDAPGISFSSQGPERSAYEQPDRHQEREDKFAAAVTQVLIQAARDNDADLVVVAPAGSLGVMRQHYDAAIKERLIAEIDKDYTGLPVDEITGLLVRHEPRAAYTRFPVPTD
ncbi:host attachment family protein [Novosphingobium sp.]|uniref:host attachment family protein n=1 Tax=Novosphingobium sp. TaxID=1874826 RepID=UPI0025DA258F|nr:host attachment family protein [Novosphingobium sp.]